MGRPTARRQLGRVVLLEREAHPPVVEEDTGVSHHQVGPVVEGIGLGEGDPEPIGVNGAQVGGVPVSQAGRRGSCRIG